MSSSKDSRERGVGNRSNRRGGIGAKDFERYRSGQESAASARRASDFHVLRYVPGESPLHKVWAGTKLVWFAALCIGLLLWPTWQAVGIGVAMMLGAFLVARLPRGITPRVPKWFLWVVAFGALLALASGGSPFLRAGALRLGFGGVGQFLRFWAITLEILAAAALVSWTTPLADLAPALGRLGRPLRHLRVPVDELVAAIGLAVRCLPLLLEEGRILSAARRSRQLGVTRTAKSMAHEVEDVIWTALANALRRSRELAEAIEARGGVATAVPEKHKLAARDGCFLALAAATMAAMALLR
ncbi:MAG: energy-coupling factor transporter transmembrane component T family protein [Acidimicrobiales bacterium]